MSAERRPRRSWRSARRRRPRRRSEKPLSKMIGGSRNSVKNSPRSRARRVSSAASRPPLPRCTASPTASADQHRRARLGQQEDAPPVEERADDHRERDEQDEAHHLVRVKRVSSCRSSCSSISTRPPPPRRACSSITAAVTCETRGGDVFVVARAELRIVRRRASARPRATETRAKGSSERHGRALQGRDASRYASAAGRRAVPVTVDDVQWAVGAARAPPRRPPRANRERRAAQSPRGRSTNDEHLAAAARELCRKRCSASARAPDVAPLHHAKKLFEERCSSCRRASALRAGIVPSADAPLVEQPTASRHAGGLPRGPRRASSAYALVRGRRADRVAPPPPRPRITTTTPPTGDALHAFVAAEERQRAAAARAARAPPAPAPAASASAVQAALVGALGDSTVAAAGRSRPWIAFLLSRPNLSPPRAGSAAARRARAAPARRPPSTSLRESARRSRRRGARPR